MGKVKVLMEVVGLLFVAILLSFVLNIYLLKNSVSIYEIFISSNKVILSETAKQQLDEIYVPMPQVEIPVCLAGEINTEQGIKINSVIKAKVLNANATNVEYIECPTYIEINKVLGTMHNHPQGSCDLSDLDIHTYVGSMQKGQEIIGIVCKEGYVFHILAKLKSEVK